MGVESPRTRAIVPVRRSPGVRPIRSLRDAARVLAGLFFLLLGLLGFFLPILQGILFTVIGAALLAPFVPLFARLREWLYRRYPRTEQIVIRFRRTWSHWTGNP